MIIDKAGIVKNRLRKKMLKNCFLDSLENIKNIIIVCKYLGYTLHSVVLPGPQNKTYSLIHIIAALLCWFSQLFCMR
jgi:hypothetical protein